MGVHSRIRFDYWSLETDGRGVSPRTNWFISLLFQKRKENTMEFKYSCLISSVFVLLEHRLYVNGRLYGM
jgi:hypothetical protein